MNDNPNKDAAITLSVIAGTGTVENAKIVTNGDGLATGNYVAGKTPGMAVVEARYTSRPPSEIELRRVLGSIYLADRGVTENFRKRATLLEWFVEPGDKVVKNQPLARVGIPNEEMVLTATNPGIFVRAVRHRRERVEVGDTIGYVELDENSYEKMLSSAKR